MLQAAQELKDSTIMMVDDEPITMEVVQTFLEEFGYNNFIQVDNALKAMEVLEQAAPDIMLLDLIMPHRSGHEILSEIRNHPRFKHLPVIVLTASSDTQDKLKALELGATDFLAKPVDQSELGLRVRNTLAAKAYLDQLAYFDPLTKLPNKHLFQQRFEWAIKKAARYQENLALLNITLDDFSRINATIGLPASDEVLLEISRRLREVVRDVDALAASTGELKGNPGLFRVEGSAFSLLLDHPKDAESSALVAERILSAIRKPITLHETEVVVTASIGIATYPNEGSDCATLHRLAISAKDYTKNRGGDGFHFSSKDINAIYERRLKMEGKLRNAIQNNELVLHYQPKVDVRTGAMEGVEALLRWQSRELGLIPPNDFIPLAEETKLILPIGEWVLLEACRTLVQWHKQGKKRLIMAVNLSALQLEDPNLLDIVKRTLQTTGVDPDCIKLEITESLLLKDIEKKIALLHTLRSLGVRLSIDDFGTGYSSLSYLAQLPVDELKIDRSFISSMEKSKESKAIVTSVIFLAHNLNLTTVAEGIETRDQLAFIQSHGCDEYQGFLYSRPQPEAEILRLLPEK